VNYFIEGGFMKTVTAAEANRGFSRLLREVGKGEEIVILSRGTPVAKLTPANAEAFKKNNMKRVLLSRLRAQRATGSRNWTREELYSDTSCE
jgi:prevent-host-death family protein